MIDRKTGYSNIRNDNMSLVLNMLLHHREMSRADIAKSTRLTRATISSLVSELIDMGYVSETGLAEMQSAGKPGILLTINPNKIFAIAVSLFLETLTVAKVNLLGEPSCIMSCKFEKEGAYAIIKKLKELIHEEINSVNEISGIAAGIGITLPGSLLEGKLIYPSSLKSLTNHNLYDFISDAFKYPIYLENDADAAALTESLMGYPQNKNLVFIQVTQGIGSGIAFEGTLYRGVHKITPEFGHTIINPAGPVCFCGKRGCLSSMASDIALCKHYLDANDSGFDSSRNQTIPIETINEVIGIFAHTSESDMPEYVWEAAEYLGMGLANVMNTICPNTIIVNGNIFKIPGYLERVRASTRKYVHPILSDYINIQLSHMGDTAPLIGAGSLVIRELYAHPSSLI